MRAWEFKSDKDVLSGRSVRHAAAGLTGAAHLGIGYDCAGCALGGGWWIATGVVVLVIGIIFFAGSSLVTPFLPGGRKFG